MYSAADEERVIAEYFGKAPGRFLDVGAYDGRTASNTRALLDNGWSGVAVEPHPAVFLRLRQEVQEYPVVCVNTALGRSEGIGCFYHWYGPGNAAASSTFDRAARDEAIEVRELPPAEQMYLPVTSVAAFLRVFEGPYDLVSIDAEGMDHLILAELPVAALGVRLICVEYRARRDEFLAWATHHGYSVLWENDCNIIFERMEP
jgi:FkbM family methyltransferase